MKNPYEPPRAADSPSLGPAPQACQTIFWRVVAVILIVGIASIIGRQWGLENSYGKFGGFGHFPIVWAGGFLVFPGYILGLLSFGGGDWILCLFVALFMLGYYLGTIFLAFKNRMKNPITIFTVSYLASLGLNFLNFIFVGLLHI